MLSIKYDNCKDCCSKCEHAGKDREFVCPGGKSCKVIRPRYNAMELAGRALYAIVYAEEEIKRGLNPSTMFDAARFYLDGLKSVDNGDFARTIIHLENKLEGLKEHA